MSITRAAIVFACLVFVGAWPAFADEEIVGISSPVVFPAFDPSAPGCSKPPGRDWKLVFLQDNSRQFMQGVARGLKAAAKDRGLPFEIRLANNDSGRMERDVDESIHERTGAVIVAPIDSEGLAPHLIALMKDGGYVGAIVPPPATTVLNAPQYATGKVLAEAAAKYISKTFDGKANIVLLTHDSNQFLSARFAAMRDVLGAASNISIVADISPQTVDQQGGYETMKLILQANPRVDVVLGADTVVLGALKALREAHLDRPDQFLGGIDGEPEAMAEVKSGISPYKVTISLNSPVFAYALAQQAADWMQGKSVPQAMDVLPVALDKDSIGQFEQDMDDPGAVYFSTERRNHYLRMYGNICYDTRDHFINFPWSSEH